MESHVREVFLKHLAASNDLNEAAVEAYRELSEEALALTYEGRVVDKAVWDMLLKIIRALARVKLYSVYYDNYPDVYVVAFGPTHFDDIYLLFQTWRDIVVFVIEHYDQFISEHLKAAINAEEMRRVLLAGIDKQIAEQSKQIAESGSVTIDRKKFETMVKGLSWGLSIIMGKTDHKKFADEFNSRRTFLERYYLLAATPPPGSSKIM